MQSSRRKNKENPYHLCYQQRFSTAKPKHFSSKITLMAVGPTIAAYMADCA